MGVSTCRDAAVRTAVLLGGKFRGACNVAACCSVPTGSCIASYGDRHRRFTIGTTNGAFLMSTVKRIAALISIVTVLGLSGCFWGRGGWGGHNDHQGDHHEGDRGSEHYS